MKRKKIIKEADLVLGQQIERRRLQLGLTRMQLGRAINETEQKIMQFERGEAFIPLPTIEAIGLVMDDPVQKKIIRRIGDLRFSEKEHGEDAQDALIELYRQIFEESPE